MSNSSSDKAKLAKLREKRDGLQDKAAQMRKKVEELKGDIEHTKRDIQSRDEQIERKTDQLMSQLQKIKAIDDEKARLLRLLEKGQEERSSINPKDKLQALMLAVQRMNSGVEGSGGTSGDSAIMSDLADMARTSHRLLTRVRAVGEEGGVSLGGGGKRRSGASSGDQANSSELNKVKVWYNKTSCTFKVTDLHTFRDLLEEVIQYWSLQPSKNVLVNAQNFVWPLNASVREVIGALPEGKDDPGAIIKVWNRDNSDRVTFDQWILHEEKLQRDREENEQMVQTSNVLLGVDAGGSSIGGTGGGATKKSEASISSTAGRGGDRGGRGGDFSGSASSNHDFGMDVTKLADQQGKKDMKRSRQKVSGKDTVDFCKYIDLFLFLLFITLFGNTLFMRRNVYRSGLTRAGVVEVLFGDSHVHVTPARSQVLYQGLTVGTQSVASVAASGVEMLKFEDIQSQAQVWQWIEGPLRSVVTGLVNGTAAVGVVEVAKDKKNVGKTFLRHNVIVGLPRVAQWRVRESAADINCVKPERLDLFMHPCLSQYQVGVNQDKGIQAGDSVAYHDEDSSDYIIQSVDTKNYRAPTYKLKKVNSKNENDKLSGVKRSEIGTSSWKSIRQLTYKQRRDVWNSTDGFTFDHETELAYTGGLLSYVPSVTGLVSDGLYGGGFATDVPIETTTLFDEHMSTLKRNVWIDEKTRAVEVAFNMYNANYDVLIVTHALFEMTPGGAVNPRKTVKVVRL